MSRLEPGGLQQALREVQPARTEWADSFDERYGPDAFANLVTQLANPRLSYAAIAGAFGVSRERVRQWHLELFPDAPRGLARRRSRGVYNQKRRLLDDPLFRAFVRAARGRVAKEAIAPVIARDGFRKRLASIGGRPVLLRRASRTRTGTGDAVRRVFSLSGSRGAAGLVFFHLDADDFLLVPRAILPAGGTTYTDSAASPYSVYRNTFAALDGDYGLRGTRVTYDGPVESQAVQSTS